MLGLRRAIRLYSSRNGPLFTPNLLNLKVGKILECKRHDNAERLFVSQIQIENETVKTANTNNSTVQVCSGLVGIIPIEQMQNKRVVVLSNLKPSKMRGVKSEAMLLAAQNKSERAEDDFKVELVNPPSDAEIGENLFFKSFESDATKPRLKSKAWEAIQKNLKINDKGIAVYVTDSGEEYPLQSANSIEYCTADTLINSSIS